jgi:hypothetical protein
MLGSKLITTTQRAALRPLGIQGQEVARSDSQLRRLLAQRLSPRHAALLAEPVPDAHGDRIDWYSVAEGEARQLNALPEEERARFQGEFERLGGDITRLAEEYLSAKDPDRQVVGRLLELALSYPESADLYVVGNQPVITCWGHGPGDPGRMPESLTRTRVSLERTKIVRDEPGSATATQAVGSGVRVAAGARGGWPFWGHFVRYLALGLVLMTVALALPPGCAYLGLGPNIWLIAAPMTTETDDAYEAARQRERALRLRLAEVTAAIGARRATCPPAEQSKAVP